MVETSPPDCSRSRATVCLKWGAPHFRHSLGICDFGEAQDTNGNIILQAVPTSIAAQNDLMRDSATGIVYSKTISVMLDAMKTNTSQEHRMK